MVKLDEYLLTEQQEKAYVQYLLEGVEVSFIKFYEVWCDQNNLEDDLVIDQRDHIAGIEKEHGVF